MSDRMDGFSVIETLFALVILSAVLVALGAGFSGGWRGIASAESDTRSLAVAQELIAREGVEWPLAAGTRSGETPDGFKYGVVITPYEARAATAAESRPAAYWVMVEVRRPWTSSGASRPVRLRTLKRVEGQ